MEQEIRTPKGCDRSPLVFLRGDPCLSYRIFSYQPWDVLPDHLGARRPPLASSSDRYAGRGRTQVCPGHFSQQPWHPTGLVQLRPSEAQIGGRHKILHYLPHPRKPRLRPTLRRLRRVCPRLRPPLYFLWQMRGRGQLQIIPDYARSACFHHYRHICHVWLYSVCSLILI